MAGHGYESGRLNLPFVGIATFGKNPYQPDWDAIDADVAILGAPFDFPPKELSWQAGHVGHEHTNRSVHRPRVIVVRRRLPAQ